jgi:RNA polymerase sigma-70 factor, ECF subfamily
MKLREGRPAAMKAYDPDSVEKVSPISKDLFGQDHILVTCLPQHPNPSREALTSFPRPCPQKGSGWALEQKRKEADLDCKRNRNLAFEQHEEVQLALNGDQEALGHLIASYMPYLYRVALRILRIPEDAEEALQDGLVQVVQHVREFEGRSKFSSWLTRIVINAALMQLRRSRREIVTPFDQITGQEDLSLAETIPASGPNPEEIYAQVEWLQILNRKLQELSPGCQSAMRLRVLEGMSTKEAAEALGIPEGSLKSNLRRARLKLKAGDGAGQGTSKQVRSARNDIRPAESRPTLDLMEDVVMTAA